MNFYDFLVQSHFFIKILGDAPINIYKRGIDGAEIALNHLIRQELNWNLCTAFPKMDNLNRSEILTDKQKKIYFIY